MSSEFVEGALIVVAYRALTVLVGGAVIWMGYRLFIVGVYERAGELKAAWGDRRLILKQAAPGTFFALFGASVLLLSVARGVDLYTKERTVDGVPASLAGGASGEQMSREMPGDQATAMGPRQRITVGPIFGEVADTLAKALKGEPINPTERARAQHWLQTERSIRYEAFNKPYQPWPTIELEGRG